MRAPEFIKRLKVKIKIHAVSNKNGSIKLMDLSP